MGKGAVLDGACLHAKPSEKEAAGKNPDGMKRAAVYCCEQDGGDKKCCYWFEHQRRHPPQELTEDQFLRNGADYDNEEQQNRHKDGRAR